MGEAAASPIFYNEGYFPVFEEKMGWAKKKWGNASDIWDALCADQRKQIYSLFLLISPLSP